MGAFLRNGFAHVDNVIPVIKTITWLLLSRLQGNKPHRNSPEPSEPQHTPELSGTFRNPPPEPTPHTGTLRNLPRPSGTNLPQPSGTRLRNLRQHTPEPSGKSCYSGTLRNLPPEPTPAHTGTLRNLPPELAPATRADTHRSLSGLKTRLAYAVGEL